MEHGDEELGELGHRAKPYLHFIGERCDEPCEPAPCQAAVQDDELRSSERRGRLDAPDGDDHLASVSAEVQILNQQPANLAWSSNVK